jgi:hypothetical protein
MTNKAMTNKEKWLKIGEAFERFAETGRLRKSACSGICFALTEVELPLEGWPFGLWPEWIEGVDWEKTRGGANALWPCPPEERRELLQVAQQVAALRALYCYFMAEAEIV